MATFTTYNQVGKAEDVSDIITDISPTDTPLYSTIPARKQRPVCRMARRYSQLPLPTLKLKAQTQPAVI